MQKWADFLISAVRYDEESKKISHLKVHPDEGLNVGRGSTWTKEEVIKAITDGKTFLTILKDEKGNWQKGSQVFIIRVNGDYIITDDKEVRMDSLAGVQEL